MKALRLTEEQYTAAVKRRIPSHKFGAVPRDGHDSTLEARRAAELVLMERAGVISELRMQHPFLLMAAQYGPAGELWERSATYIADYVYVRDGRTIVEDCKGCKDGTAYQNFVLKRKMLLFFHGLRVIEIGRVRR